MDDFTEQDDQRLRAALHSVALPVGLRERIRERLRTESILHSDLVGASASATTVKAVAISNSQPTEVRSYRRQFIGLAVAASLVGLLVAWANWNSPLSPEQLASFTLEQLDEIRDDDATWQAELPSRLDALRTLGSKVRPFVALRFQERSGGSISEKCLVWELQSTTTNKRFFVFEFEDSGVPSALSSQLQAIYSVSGGMRLFAMYSSQRVLVVAFEGRAEDYLNLLPAA